MANPEHLKILKPDGLRAAVCPILSPLILRTKWEQTNRVRLLPAKCVAG